MFRSFFLYNSLALFMTVGLQTNATAGQSYKGIREVDFRNFIYQPKMCHKGFGEIGIGTSVRVKDGARAAEGSI